MTIQKSAKIGIITATISCMVLSGHVACALNEGESQSTPSNPAANAPTIQNQAGQPVQPTEIQIELILLPKQYFYGDDLDLKAKIIKNNTNYKLKLKVTRVDIPNSPPKLININETAGEINLANYLRSDDLLHGDYVMDILATSNDSQSELYKSKEVNLKILPKITPPSSPNENSASDNVAPAPQPAPQPKPEPKEAIINSKPLKTLEPVKSDTHLSTNFSAPYVFGVTSSKKSGSITAVTPTRVASRSESTINTINGITTKSNNVDKLTEPEKVITLTAKKSNTAPQSSKLTNDKNHNDNPSQTNNWLDWRVIGAGIGVLAVATIGFCRFVIMRK